MIPGAALFLDRDGAIIEDGGYMSRPSQIRLLPGAREAVRLALTTFRLYLVTNQSGIGRGFYSLKDAETCNQRMFELLDLSPGRFHGVCIASETSEVPPIYRKPSPRFLLEMMARDRLDRRFCWMVGDRLSDLQCGINAGIRSALVRQSEHSATADILAFARAHRIPAFATLADCVEALIGGVSSSGEANGEGSA